MYLGKICLAQTEKKKKWFLGALGQREMLEIQEGKMEVGLSTRKVSCSPRTV